MRLLTDQEITDIFATCHDRLMYTQDNICGPKAMRETEAHAIEDAVIKKLAAGVAVNPDDASAWIYQNTLECFKESETFGHAYSIKVGCPDDVSVPLFTQDQLNIALAAARVQENERCASRVAVWDESFNTGGTFAGAIRALIGGKQE